MNRDCTVKACKDAATVTVDRDGKPYCRPHGLAEARRLPISDISAIQDELTARTIGLIGSCNACGSAVYIIPVSGVRTMLDYGKLPRDPRPGDALLNYAKGTGRIVEQGDDLDRVMAWVAAGRVGLHRLHQPMCVGKRGPHAA